MPASSLPQDPLVMLLRQQKQLFDLQHQHMSHQEQKRLWTSRVNDLNAALTQDTIVRHPIPTLQQSAPTPASMTRTKTVPSVRRRSNYAHIDTMQHDRRLDGGHPMSRKRSSDGRVVNERMLLPSATFHSGEHGDRNNDAQRYLGGSAPKMMRTPLGSRKPVPRIQTPSFQQYGRMDAKFSASSSTTTTNTSPNVGTLPHLSSPFTSPLPTSTSDSFSTSYGSSGNQGMMPLGMSRQNSLSGFYSSVANMNLASSADDLRHFTTSQGTRLSTYGETSPFREELGPSSAPIPIPRRRSGSNHSRRLSNNNLGPRSRASLLPPTINEQQLVVPSIERRSPPNRRIAPRPTAGSEASSPSSSDDQLPKIIKTVDADGKSVEKYQISKVNRPKKEKEKQYFCEECDRHPQGFRGPHELQRHYEAQHALVKKAWICIDGSENKDKLSDCKWCQQKKTYPAYYNAAAHIRRIHFKPGPEDEDSDRPRGGYSGGRYPPMDVLKKNWMRQVELRNGQIVDEHEQPDMEMVDEEELHLDDGVIETINLEESSPLTAPSGIVGSKTRGDSLAKQADAMATLTAPKLSTTVETAATSFSEGLPYDRDAVSANADADEFGIQAMLASGLLGSTASDPATAAAAAAAATGELHRSFCSIDVAEDLGSGMSFTTPDFDFAEIFTSLDVPLPQMTFEEGES